MSETLPEGAIVAERLKVVRLLGTGGMGAVYEVEHLITRHRRALKLLHAEVATTPGVIERFLLEASAAGRVGNRHIVETFDAGTTEHGQPYIVMELLKGRSLSELLEQRGVLGVPETAEILAQACEGVQAAHDAGIVHRDLKPENLFVVEGERPFVKIVDFGISKFDPAKTGMTSATVDGSIMGTPYYMSPEQVRGAKHVDKPSDIYALGVVLYECLVGRKPFDAATLPELAILIHEGRYAPASTLRPDLPAALDAIIARSLAARPEDRFADAHALGEALRRATDATAQTLWNPSFAPPAPAPAPVGLDLGTSPALSHTNPAAVGTAPGPNVAPARGRGWLVLVGVAAIAAVAVAVALSRRSLPAPSEPERLERSNTNAAQATREPANTPPPAPPTVSAAPAVVDAAAPAPSLAPASSARAKSVTPKPTTSTTRARERGLSEENPFR